MMAEHVKKNKSANILWLLLAAVFTVVLWRVPGGQYIVYPFSILATWFHEMGHGLTAMVLGGDFSHLKLFADGSGLATYQGLLWGGDLGKAMFSAGGPLGPSLAGFVCIVAGKRQWTARVCLLGLGAFMVVSTILWMRTSFGFAIMVAFGVLMLSVSLKAAAWVQSFVIEFIGVQACVSVFKQVDYLFTESVHIDGKQMLSDTGAMAQALFLPYWFWGGLLSALTVLLLGLALLLVFLEKPTHEPSGKSVPAL